MFQTSRILFRRCCIILMLCWGIGGWIQEAKGQFAGGSGTSSDPYLIETAAQLAKLAELVNAGNTAYHDKCYKLMYEIDLSEYGANWNGGKGWIPIGNSDSRSFRGEFDGNNKKITGLYINTNSLNVGLFGYIWESVKIQNLGIEEANIKGFAIAATVGSVVGAVHDASSVIGCYVTGTVSGNSSTVGGVVGRVASRSTITNCYFSGTASTIGNVSWIAVGGVVGVVISQSSVINCYSTGVVSNNHTGDINSENGIGGVAGIVEIGCSITNCYSTCAVSSNTSAYAYVGGVVGFARYSSSVTNCYATGTVSSEARNLNSSVGGVVGLIDGTVTNCAALNQSVKGNSNVGRMAWKHPWAIFSGNIAFCGMTTGGGVAFTGENTHDGLGGENRSPFDLQTAAGFPSDFTSSPWTNKPGKLPGLFGETVEMPEYLRTYINSLIVTLNTDGKVTIYPISFVEDDPNICNLTFLFVVNGKDYPSLTYTCSDIGSHTVSIVAIDPEGNHSPPHKVTFEIIEPDEYSLVFDVTPSRNITLDDFGSITVYPVDFVTNVMYGCPSFLFVVDNIDYASLPFSCNNIGSHTVSIVAIDRKGNRSQSKPVTFKVSDQIPPDFNVIPNRNVALDNNGNITVDPVDFVTNVSDNCSNERDITFRFVVGGKDQEDLTFTCDGIGSHTVQIVAIDANKNRSQPKPVTFTISDQTPPIARCKTTIPPLYMVGDRKATLTTSMIDNGSTDNCGVASRQIKRTSDSDDQYVHSLDFDLNDLEGEEGGRISVTLRVIDASGNKATCISEIRLIEQVNPSGLGDIPGIFTPNGDGFNDAWEIPEIDQYPKASIRIYNRAKKLMVELKGAQMPWDGRDRNGNLLESGYYLYQIELRRGGKIISGYVTILR